jgi:hypothetical protein
MVRCEALFMNGSGTGRSVGGVDHHGVVSDYETAVTFFGLSFLAIRRGSVKRL